MRRRKTAFYHARGRRSGYRPHLIWISLCSNYTAHLWPSDALNDTEARLLELWDFTGPRIAWYLDALVYVGALGNTLDDTEKTE